MTMVFVCVPTVLLLRGVVWFRLWPGRRQKNLAFRVKLLSMVCKA